MSISAKYDEVKLFTCEEEKKSFEWFKYLRDEIRRNCEEIERLYFQDSQVFEEEKLPKFNVKKWDYSRRENSKLGDVGGGEISLLKGNVFEKIGVNISAIKGTFPDDFAKKIPGTESLKCFFATGISLVAHMKNPHVPAMHFNTRFIKTEKSWFGGGGDITPVYENKEEVKIFHDYLKAACNKHDKNYYKEFSKKCDEYFYLKHRKEPRGAGGIFYDYLFNSTKNSTSKTFEENFAFTKDVGILFAKAMSDIVTKQMKKPWTEQERKDLMKKRGRYVEFNLLYDRGTHFGLSTGGNVDAILMSMPPIVTWD